MLSKEEIKNKINLKDRTKYAIEKSKNIIKEHKEEKGDCSIEVSLAYDMQYVEEYIDHLESDKQKLIEKLEKIKYDLEFDRRKNNYSYLYDIKELAEITEQYVAPIRVNKNKINELVQAVKQLNKEIKSIKEK